jgi:uncharacterized membrane protein
MPYLKEKFSVRAQNFKRSYLAIEQKLGIAIRKSPKLLRNYFLTGLLVLLPLYVTVWILVWLIGMIDGTLQPIFYLIWGRTLPGLGFVVVLLLVVTIGGVASKVAGRKLLNYLESLLLKVPVIRILYQGIKQIMDSFTDSGRSGFTDVVLLEFPRQGMRTIGLVTNKTTDANGEKTLNVFIPTAPNPTSGFLQIVPEKDVVPVNMSIDDALKMIVSAGKVNAADFDEMLAVGKRPDKRTPKS